MIDRQDEVILQLGLAVRAKSHFLEAINRRIVDHELGVREYSDQERALDHALIDGISTTMVALNSERETSNG